MNTQSKILIVDDEEFNIDYLEQELKDLHYDTLSARNGREALEKVENENPDVILLDIMMPEMDGFEVLQHLKANHVWRHIPVIIVSALGDFDSVVKGIEMGADEYLPKPFDLVFLKARLRSSLEKKRWRDQEQVYLQIIQTEREKSERLLRNILPDPIAERLKQGERIIADSFSEATVLFADIVGFTPLSSQLSPSALITLLDEIFTAFDQQVAFYNLEKIKTIGDAYMVVGGVPLPRSDHAEAIADLALSLQHRLGSINASHETALKIRIGIHMGPVVAGVIGRSKFSYDLWGDTVNIASRMESHGIADKIQVTEAVYTHLQHAYHFEKRGEIDVKGKGKMCTFFLANKR
ncbi:MAG: response regulator [Anaerolineae bacterium]|nr:response regulator [Anaerolineae bacterium]